MRNQIVATRYALLLGENIAQLLARRPDSGRFGIVEGPAGTGKTTVAKTVAKQYGGLYYSVTELESPRSLFSGLLNELSGWTVELHQTQRLRERFMFDLEQRGWPPLMLDEADRLDRVRNGISLLEVLRDIHDGGRSPIVLFSIANLARRLANPSGGYQEAFSSRVAARIRFERASLEDAELLAQRLLDDVKFDGDLIAHCVAASGGSFRPLLGLFAEIERLAKTARINKINLAKYQQLASFAGLPAAAARRAKGSKAAA